jgi:glycerol-3-phosphate acyltransferase PlsX
MGGDFGPSVTVPATLNMLYFHIDLEVFLVGSLEELTPLLKTIPVSISDRLKIIPTKSVIESNLPPRQVIRMSEGSSMRTTLELVKSGEVHACVSAGSTVALVCLAKLLLNPLRGINRLALTSMLPNKLYRKTVILDLGACTSFNSSTLVQFAEIGSIVALEMLDIAQPRVALLNIGQEESRGLETIRKAATILRKISKINYIGFLEGHDLLSGQADVLVCDGFTGNIMLKTMEGVVKTIHSLLKSTDIEKSQELGSHLFQENGFLDERLQYLNPDNYNGALLLGLHEIVVKSHGAASQHAFIGALEQAKYAVNLKINKRIAGHIDAKFVGSN